MKISEASNIKFKRTFSTINESFSLSGSQPLNEGIFDAVKGMVDKVSNKVSQMTAPSKFPMDFEVLGGKSVKLVNKIDDLKKVPLIYYASSTSYRAYANSLINEILGKGNAEDVTKEHDWILKGKSLSSGFTKKLQGYVEDFSNQWASLSAIVVGRAVGAIRVHMYVEGTTEHYFAEFESVEKFMEASMKNKFEDAYKYCSSINYKEIGFNVPIVDALVLVKVLSPSKVKKK
jgi:hypothetical protein